MHIVRNQYVIQIDDKRYPEKLRNIENPPVTLYCIGDISILDATAVAIVGARRASDEGIKTARSFGKTCAANGTVLVNGGAIGIDTAAIDGALSVGGKVIAVLGCGADVIYPKSNAKLFERVLDTGGCIVSEQPWGTDPVSAYFVGRNRIITALSDGVTVVEAAAPSGTFRTAEYAIEQGKDIAAVPGCIYNQHSKGCNILLSQGATCLYDKGEFFAFLALVRQTTLF